MRYLVMLPMCLGIGVLFTDHAPSARYHIAKRILVDSGSVGFMAVDARRRRLYGAGHKVIDIDHDSIIGALPAGSGYSFALAPDLGVGITRAGTVFDASTLEVTRNLGAEGHIPVYDITTHRILLLGSGVDQEPRNMMASVFDLVTGAQVASFNLNDEPGAAVADGKGSVFISLPDKNEILVLDTKSLQETAHWDIPGCFVPYGIAIDTAGDRLFTSCYNHLLFVSDSRTGRVVASVSIRGVAHQLAFDRIRRLILNPNSDGTMTAIHQDGVDNYKVAGESITAEGDSSVVVDEQTGHAFMYHRAARGVNLLILAPE